jgi:hypothetical protein
MVSQANSMVLHKLNSPSSAFCHAELLRANAQWGCNCGPAALATMLGVKPDDIRHHIPAFEQKRFTNPTMMSQALKSLGVATRPADNQQKLTAYGICRIQWEGPWSQPGVHPARAYPYTHWIGSMVHKVEGEEDPNWVYDVNEGWLPLFIWSHTTVREITSWYKGATGGWFPTHRWELIYDGNGRF